MNISPPPQLANRFWAVAIATIAVGPFLATQSIDTVGPLAVAAASLAAVVVLTWLAEASRVVGWPVRIATFAAGASASAALLPWSGELVAWLAVLAFASVAAEDAKPNVTKVASDDRGHKIGHDLRSAVDSESAADNTDDENDPGLVSSLIRRIDDGIETVEGLVIANDDGPTHVVFHPPMANVPDVELHDVDNCEPRLAEATPYGFRVTTKAGGRVAYSASAPAA